VTRFRDERLELDVRERQIHFLGDRAPGLGERLLEAFDRFLAGAVFFQVSVTTLRWPLSYITLPIGCAGCQLENDVRKMFGAHWPPVAALAPRSG
jgi:hypothetical protein